MLVELGNHAPYQRDHDGQGGTRITGLIEDGVPRVTQITIPDWDDGSTHPMAKYRGPHPHDPEPTGTLVKPGPRLGGYTHEVGGLTVVQFKEELAEVALTGRPFRLPGHEAVLAVTNAWREHGSQAPKWVHVTPRDERDKEQVKVAADLNAFLDELWGTGGERKPASVENEYWTRYGPPGEGPIPGQVVLPKLEAIFTNDGRNQQYLNYAGGLAGTTGTATATGTTSLTTGAITSVATNAYAGFRIYTPTAWANIISHTSGTTPVFTIDRWYSYVTPGGSAASTPSGTTTWVIADGGMTSAWFVGLTTTNITPAVTDHTLSGEYVVASSGFLRKIAPVALTSGVSPLGYTLTPVWTANASDTLPSTFYADGVFTSMVVSFGGAGGPMKFETSLNASATIAAINDQVTVTHSGAGS